jgi:hypothetical protein
MLTCASRREDDVRGAAQACIAGRAGVNIILAQQSDPAGKTTNDAHVA